MQYAYYTARQVAELAGCSKIWVQKNLERKKLPSFRQGKYGQDRSGRHIILAADAARFISDFRVRRTLREADKLDRPILSIELDGMAYGFNAGGRYIAEIPVERNRRYMMELKLKAAQKSGYPFFVVSPPDFEPLAADLAWSIVDGVVGSVLANRRLRELTRNFSAESVGMSQDEFENLSGADRDELIQGWLDSAEVDCQLDLNPLFKLEAKLECELGPAKTSYRYKTEPDTEAITDPLEHAKAFPKVVRWICEYTAGKQTIGPVTAKASVPNFDGIGVLGMSLSQQIAAITALGSLRSRERPLQ